MLGRDRIWAAVLAILAFAVAVPAQQPAAKQKGKADLSYPPKLPDGKEIVSDTAEEFLKPPATLKEGVAIAKQAPTVDFMYYPGQTYPGNPWSNWGDSLAADGKYYASIGDHRAPG